MNWWDTFVENFKIFWEQPVPIIGFTVGTIIIGLIVIISKTSIGKKALNKIKAINNDLMKKNEEVLNKCEEYRNKLIESESALKESIKNKEQEINQIINEYQLKLAPYKKELEKLNELVAVICENSVNKKIKESYQEYRPVVIDTPVPQIVEEIKSDLKLKYEDRLKALEDIINGERKETEDNQTTSE